MIRRRAAWIAAACLVPLLALVVASLPAPPSDAGVAVPAIEAIAAADATFCPDALPEGCQFEGQVCNEVACPDCKCEWYAGSLECIYRDCSGRLCGC